MTLADVLADVERGLSWEFICYRWGDGKITKEAIAEAVQLARRAWLASDGRLICVHLCRSVVSLLRIHG